MRQFGSSISQCQGAVVKSYDYDEFGVTTSTGDTFFNEVTFTGSIADASGLLYMNARYYNPTTARFLSQDTYTGSASDPWTQHLYAYCNNNPVNMVDPTGHMAKPVRLPIHLPLPIHLSLPKNSISNGVTPDSENKPVPEFTEKPDNSQIYELIKANVQKAKSVRLLAENLTTVGMLDQGLMRYARVKTIKYGWFLMNVKAGGPMDYKEKDNWEKALPGLPYPLDNGERQTYLLNGRTISASDLGNINYGAVGAALGIPKEILLWQAGAAQLRKPMEQGGEGLGFFSSEIPALGRGYAGYFGDQRDDQYYVALGFDLYMGGYFG